MDYLKLFNEYKKSLRYRSEYRGIKYKDYERWIAKVNYIDDFDMIESWLLSKRTDGKEKDRLFLVEFYDYIKEKTGIKVKSRFYDKKFYDNLERRLQIAKYLHTPHTRDEILDQFLISENTLEGDLRVLENGVAFMGVNVVVKKKLYHGTYCYENTMHPIFLGLSLTEVYTFTTYLRQNVKENSPAKDIIERVTNMIYAQLTDYAKDVITHGEEYGEVNPIITIGSFDDLSRNEKVMELLKSGKRFDISFPNEDSRLITLKNLKVCNHKDGICIVDDSGNKVELPSEFDVIK